MTKDEKFRHVHSHCIEPGSHEDAHAGSEDDYVQRENGTLSSCGLLGIFSNCCVVLAAAFFLSCCREIVKNNSSGDKLG